MQRQTAIAAIPVLAASLLLSSGCSHSPRTAAVPSSSTSIGVAGPTLGLNDNGHTFSVRQGATLKIALDPTRFGWGKTTVSNSTVLEIRNIQRSSDGQFSANLHAVAPGRSQVVVDYRCTQGTCGGWGVFVIVTD